ncbi:MAG: polysaccharide biosynthesis C-terminal domain-containing protein [Cyclobacteriaceae bacterium]|nr:polysaccharide biosynthesis C-terminal domain-containing protein [Cyclobacteriaceae bacterium]
MSISNRVWSMMSNVVELAFGVGLMIFVTRGFTVQESGNWFLFIAIFALLSGLRDALVQSALVKAVVDEGVGRFGVLKTNLVITMLTEVVLSLGVTLFAFLSSGSLSSLLIVYPLYALPNALFRWHVFYLRGNFRIREILLTHVINILVVAAGFVVVLAQGGALRWVPVILGTGSGVALLYAGRLVPWSRLRAASFSRHAIADIWHFGGFGMLREAVSAVSSRISLFYAGSMLNLQATAMLGVSQRFAQIALLPNNAFQAVMFPTLMKMGQTGDREGLRQSAEKSLSTLLALTVPITIVGIIASPWLLELVSGPAYRSAWGIMSVYVLVAAVITPFGTSFGSLVTALSKPGIAFRLVLFNSFLNIVAGYLLIHFFGVWGAPLAMLATEVQGLFWVITLSARIAGIRYGRVFTGIPQVYSHGWAQVRSRLGKPEKAHTYVKL